MRPPPGRSSTAAAWFGATARILAFVALFMVLGVALGTAWAALPLPQDGAWLFAGTSVTAAAALIAGVVLVRFVDGRPAGAIGIAVSRETAVHAAIGTAIGAAALAVAVFGMLAAGSLRFTAQPGGAGEWLGVVLAQAAVFTVAALAEEALFRGYAFQVFVRVAGPAVATAVSSVLFAVAHAANPEVGPFALLNIFLAGIVLAIAYLRTLSLWFATAVHLGWNWAMATLFDLPVSGITIFDTPGYDAVVGGPDWWSGGAFGPEGGLVGTLGFAFALGALLWLRRIRPDPAIAAAAPLVLDGHREGTERTIDVG